MTRCGPLHLVGPAETPEPGARLPAEPAHAYQSFCVYRDMPASKRSVAQAAEKLAAEVGTGRSGGFVAARLRQMERNSAKFHWVARSLQWDDHLDSKRRLAMVEDAIEMAQRHRAIARLGLNRVAEKLRSIAGTDLSLSQIPAYLTACATLERLSCGLPTEVGEQTLAAKTGYYQTAMADPEVAEAAEAFMVKVRDHSAANG